jgi:hypothetical protein
MPEQTTVAVPHDDDAADRVALVREAGWGKVSWFSVVCGIFAAYGAFVIVLGAASAVLSAFGVDTDELSDNDWTRLGWVAAGAVAVVLLVAYWIGGYVAGRMARRAGLLHGALVLVFGIVILVVVAAIAHVEEGTDAILDRLDSLGIPTSRDEWTDVGTVAGISALVAMIVGSLAGGRAGERWHQRLTRRAADPDIGPDAELRAVAAARRREAEEATDRARRAEADARPHDRGARRDDDERTTTGAGDGNR